jgi:hypothetical protein
MVTEAAGERNPKEWVWGNFGLVGLSLSLFSFS